MKSIVFYSVNPLRMESTLTQRARVGVEDFTLLEEYQDINAFVENLRKRFVENLIYVSDYISKFLMESVLIE